MLALSEFFAGTIADAPFGSLILPTSKYDRQGIIASQNGLPFFVILGDDHRFQGFPSVDNTSHKGVIVPNVAVEVDEASIGQLDSWDTPLGSIICAGGEIGIRVAAVGNMSAGRFVAKLAEAPSTSISASFSKWRIVLGAGMDKRILLSIDTNVRQ